MNLIRTLLLAATALFVLISAAAAEVPCRVELVRGTVNVNGKPLDASLQLDVQWTGTLVTCTARGGSPPYGFSVTYQTGGKRNRTISRQYTQSNPSLGLEVGPILKETMTVSVQDSTGRSASGGGNRRTSSAADSPGAVFTDHVIETGPNSRARLVFPDGAVFLIKSNTRVTVQNEGVHLQQGASIFEMSKQGKTFQVVVPSHVTCSGMLGGHYDGASPEGRTVACSTWMDVSPPRLLAQEGGPPSFYVEADRSGASVYAIRGSVKCVDARGRSTVIVPAGHVSFTPRGGVPAAPKPFPAGEAGRRFDREGSTSGPQRPERVLFFNGNDGGVSGGGKSPTFTVDTRCTVTLMWTYHHQYDGTPGQLALRDSRGKLFGPWKASGNSKSPRPNWYWEVRPNVTLEPGTYTVVDSSPQTWSQNSGSGGCGMVQIKGR